MHDPGKILVPVDFSDSSRAALACAGDLAARLHAEVDVLHVWSPPHDPTSAQELLSDFARSDLGHRMMEWLGALARQRDVAAHGRLATGDREGVPDAIVDVASSGDYDLVVMGAHVHHRLRRFLHGGVTQEVMRRAPCPVLTVHAPPDADSEDDPPSNDLDASSVWIWPS